MIKTKYTEELAISSSCQAGSRGKDVKKIQEWLNIQAHLNRGTTLATGIDGDYGPATTTSVKNFQTLKGLPINGKVDNKVFAELSRPMKDAYTFWQYPPRTLRMTVCAVAETHEAVRPIELSVNGIGNLGPWVRAYCNGNDGNEWYWCMGFVQTVFDQAFENMEDGSQYSSLMPLSYSCDTIAAHAIQKKKLITNAQVRKNPGLVQPGDIFLVKKAENDWYHTGIIIGVTGDLFETIEGNTNADGSNNGYGVFRRTRNFRKSNLDVFSIS